MVMYIPQGGSPEFYPEEDIGQPDETSEVEVKRISLPSFGGSRPDPRSYEAKFTGTGRSIPLGEAEEKGWVPPREELQKLPKTILLKIAIELNPDKVAESYQEGWTKADILRIIEKHVSTYLGSSGTEGGEYIQDLLIIESEVEEG